MASKVSIFYVEDNPYDQKLTLAWLTRLAPHYEVTLAETIAAAKLVLSRQTFDVVLLDYQLPDGNGIELVRWIDRQKIDCGKIIITALRDEELAITALRSGADDYVAKQPGHMESLTKVIESVLLRRRRRRMIHDQPLATLLCDSDKAHRILCKEHLEKLTPHVIVKEISTGAETLRLLQAGTYEMLVCEANLADMSVLTLIKEVTAFDDILPIVVCTSKGNEEIALQSMKLGAYDCIFKSGEYGARLANMIERGVSQYRLLKTASALEQQVVETNLVKTKIRDSKKMLQTAFDAIAEPLIFMDQNMIIKTLNRAAADYYQIEFNKAIGKPYHQITGESPTICEGCRIKDLIAQGQHKTIETRGTMDPERFKEITVYPSKGNDTNSNGAIIRINDVTEAKMLQKKLAQREKLSALGLLVSGIAHEINNPNNFITFNVPVLREHLEELLSQTDGYARENPQYEPLSLPYKKFRQNIFDLLDYIEHGSTRIKTTVAQLKGFVGNKENSYARPVDVPELIERVLNLCNRELKKASVSVQIDTPKNIPAILTDPNILEQVFVNLLINGCHAMDKTENRITINVLLNIPSPYDVTILIEDNGCGMDVETQSKIFDPFFSTKEPGLGTGLGLYICYYLIEEMGGRIEVQSRPGEGSTFRIVLPGSGQKQ